MQGATVEQPSAPTGAAPVTHVLVRGRPVFYEFACLSRQERGEHGGDPEGHFPRAVLHRFRPDLDGPRALVEFLALPEDLQAAYDRDLEREIEEARR